MKKQIVSVLLIMFLLLPCFGCADKEAESNEYIVKVCGFSDSIPETDHKLEYSLWSEGKYTDTTIVKQVDFLLGNSQIKGSYKDSERKFYNCFSTHRYLDANNRFFEIDSNQKLTSYFWGSAAIAQEPSAKLSADECKEIACSFLGKIVDIKDYTVSVNYDETNGKYSICFEKYIGTLKTADQATVVVEENGNLYSYTSSMLGHIPTDVVPEYDQTAVQQAIEAKLEKIYAKAKSTYDEVNYDDFEYVLTKVTDTDFALVCVINVSCLNHYGEFEEITSERLRLIIE